MTKLLGQMTSEEIENDERLNMGVLLDRFSNGILAGYEGQTSEYGDDALAPLADAAVIRDWIEREIPRLVETARDGGASWDQIGETLGVTRQAVWERYGSGGWNKGLKEARVDCPTCGKTVAKSWLKRHLATH